MVTDPSGATLRTSIWSWTYKTPSGPNAKLLTMPKLAVVAGPSELPYVPLPEKVVTVPSVAMRRIRYPVSSPTYTTPAASTAIADGSVNVAEAAGPFAYPATPVPA